MISPGTMLGGRYRLDERIASGGMGDVWRCVDDVLGRTIAVKILLPSLLEEPGFTERFRVEARTMATINHPGVVDVYDYGSDSAAGAYLVMEYVEGDALSRTLAQVVRLTPARTMALVAQAADALHAAHEKGVVHRDVKPGNLLVRPNGTLVLTDFGIARSVGATQLTAAGSVLGTASYISPEQAMGEQATASSDIYALGVVAYQCLAGRRPFEGDNPLEIAMRHVREVPAPLPSDIHPPVRGIVERAMAKDPAARWPTAAAFATVARRAAGELAAASTRPGGAPVTGMPGHPPRPGGHGPSTPTPTPISPGGAPISVGTRSVANQPPGQIGHLGPPRPPGVMAPPGYPRGQTPGYLRAPVPSQPQRTSTALVVAIIVAVVLVAVCVGAAIAIWQESRKANPQGWAPLATAPSGVAVAGQGRKANPQGWAPLATAPSGVAVAGQVGAVAAQVGHAVQW